MQEAACAIEDGDLQATEETWSVTPDQFAEWLEEDYPDLIENLKRE